MNPPAPETPSSPDALLDQARLDPAQAASLHRVKSGANWLFWIAGMSIVNTLLIRFEASFKFSLGLGFTEVIYAIGHQIGPVFANIAFALDAVFLAGLVVLGLLAGRMRLWAFITGIVIMVLDTVLLGVLAGTDELLSIGIHVWAVIAMWGGMNALRDFRRRAVALATPAEVPAPALPQTSSPTAAPATPSSPSES